MKATLHSVVIIMVFFYTVSRIISNKKKVKKLKQPIKIRGDTQNAEKMRKQK